MIGFLIWFISGIIAVIIWATHTINDLDFDAADALAATFTCVCPIYNTFYVIIRFPRFCKELKNSKFFEKLKNM